MFPFFSDFVSPLPVHSLAVNRVDVDDNVKPANLANSAVLKLLEEEERQKQAGGKNNFFRFYFFFSPHLNIFDQPKHILYLNDWHTQTNMSRCTKHSNSDCAYLSLRLRNFLQIVSLSVRSISFFFCVEWVDSLNYFSYKSKSIKMDDNWNNDTNEQNENF